MSFDNSVNATEPVNVPLMVKTGQSEFQKAAVAYEPDHGYALTRAKALLSLNRRWLQRGPLKPGRWQMHTGVDEASSGLQARSQLRPHWQPARPVPRVQGRAEETQPGPSGLRGA
jgi:hypothetical protein